MPIDSPDLSNLSDGIYKGEFSDGGGIYNVYVEINNHKILNIILETDQDSRYVDYARPVTGRIIEEQTLLVDAVTGATTTSKCIIKAVEEALKKKQKQVIL
jgi:uncharacterized protein with FMN-binding domain